MIYPSHLLVPVLTYLPMIPQLEDKIVKFQLRAARVILDCDLYTPSSELFKELNWQTFPERVTYQNAILM